MVDLSVKALKIAKYRLFLIYSLLEISLFVNGVLNKV